MRSVLKILRTVLILILSMVGVQLAEVLPSQEPGSGATPEDFEQTTEKPGQLFRVFGIGMVAASAADVATTEWALRSLHLREGNPLMVNQGVRLAAHAALPVAAWWTTEWMHRRGSGKAGLFLRIGITVGYTAIAVHNARLALRN